MAVIARVLFAFGSLSVKMADGSVVEVQKKKRRVFKTREESLQARKEKEKRAVQKRIALGSAWPEWERQRAICGGVGHVDFVHHLLAVHQGRCSNFAALSPKT